MRLTMFDDAISPETSPRVIAMQDKYPSTRLKASGLAVGLPEGQMGNSEVGHLNIGAGRVIYQELTRITKAIEDGDFFTNPALVKAMDDAKRDGKKLHVMGLVSDGGVHSHITHLFALVEMAKRRGLDNVYIHCFMDGRDTPPESGKGYIEQLQAHLDKLGFGKIATISGRFYAMDRDNIWDRVQKAYEALVDGKGIEESDPIEAMQNSYDKGVRDGRRGRQRRLLQLPSRPRASDHPFVHLSRLRVFPEGEGVPRSALRVVHSI